MMIRLPIVRDSSIGPGRTEWGHDDTSPHCTGFFHWANKNGIGFFAFHIPHGTRRRSINFSPGLSPSRTFPKGEETPLVVPLWPLLWLFSGWCKSEVSAPCETAHFLKGITWFMATAILPPIAASLSAIPLSFLMGDRRRKDSTRLDHGRAHFKEQCSDPAHLSRCCLRSFGP